MIVLDASYFLRYLNRPRTPNDVAMHEQAQALFRLVRTGQETFTTSEAVVAEVVFILHARRHYGFARSNVAARVKPLLAQQGCKMPRKRVVLAAFDLWEATPAISFVDALAIMQSQDLNAALGSFDAAVGRVPGVTLWQPPANALADSNGTS